MRHEAPDIRHETRPPYMVENAEASESKLRRFFLCFVGLPIWVLRCPLVRNTHPCRKRKRVKQEGVKVAKAFAARIDQGLFDSLRDPNAWEGLSNVKPCYNGVNPGAGKACAIRCGRVESCWISIQLDVVALAPFIETLRNRRIFRSAPLRANGERCRRVRGLLGHDAPAKAT